MNKQIRSTTEETAVVNKLFKDAAETIEYLYSRWQDEQGFEDFKDYADKMKEQLPPGLTFIRAGHRPFCMYFKNERGLKYRIGIFGGYYQWTRA